MKRGFFKIEEIVECLYVDKNNLIERRSWWCRGEMGELLEWLIWFRK